MDDSDVLDDTPEYPKSLGYGLFIPNPLALPIHKRLHIHTEVYC